MSQLPPEAIDDFNTLWKKHHGVELPRGEAEVRAHQVFAVLRLLLEKPCEPFESTPTLNALPETRGRLEQMQTEISIDDAREN